MATRAGISIPTGVCAAWEVSSGEPIRRGRAEHVKLEVFEAKRTCRGRCCEFIGHRNIDRCGGDCGKIVPRFSVKFVEIIEGYALAVTINHFTGFFTGSL